MNINEEEAKINVKVDSSQPISVNVEDRHKIDVVVGDAAKMECQKAINYIKSGKAEIAQEVDNVINEFNVNASARTLAFNTNATNKTNTFNQNATDKTTAFNNNANSKTTDFNDNYTAKKALIGAEVQTAKEWAIGEPTEPTGYSAKYWADEASSTLSSKANVDLSNLSATGEAKFNAKQNVLTAGTGINITGDVISATNTGATWGSIRGTLSNQTDLNNALDKKLTFIVGSLPEATEDDVDKVIYYVNSANEVRPYKGFETEYTEDEWAEAILQESEPTVGGMDFDLAVFKEVYQMEYGEKEEGWWEEAFEVFPTFTLIREEIEGSYYARIYWGAYSEVNPLSENINAAFTFYDEDWEEEIPIEDIESATWEIYYYPGSTYIEYSWKILTTTNVSANWGRIQGSINSQTDLKNALNAKYDASNPNGYTSNVGTVTSVNNVSPDNDGDVTLSIPTVNNATLTITQGGVSKGTFTANASSDVTIALDAIGSAAWGSITGTLSNQTDLSNALSGKADVDLSNINASASAKETIVGWGIPDMTRKATLSGIYRTPVLATQNMYVWGVANGDCYFYVSSENTYDANTNEKRRFGSQVYWSAGSCIVPKGSYYYTSASSSSDGNYYWCPLKGE